MNTFLLAAGVAALAISAPAAAKPGGGNGGGQAAHAQHGGGGAKAARGGGGGGAPKMARGGGGQKAHAPMRFAQQQQPKAHKAPKVQQQQRFAKADRGPQMKHDRKANAQHFDRQVRMAGNGKGQDKAIARQMKQVEKGRGQLADRVFDRRNGQAVRIADANRNIDIFRDRDWQQRAIALNANGFANGCPPGLAKKAVACVPPGQAKQLVGQRYDTVQRALAMSALPSSLSYLYPDTDDYYYRYGNGYAYQVNRESQLISALLPLFGLGVGVGQQFPTNYMGSNYMLPTSLQPFYASYPNTDYRYANGYVYEIDPYTGLVQDVDPMLGYGYGYGQMMPASYSAYNVPYNYRPLYQDSSDYYYRYAPGSIYRVDAGSGLIDQVAALLTGGFGVGQPLPAGYGAYNVPLGYRDQYYDTPNDWYRYADGNIYRVDPTTQLVTAIVAALT
ncbi:hypothetical protein G7078_00975 [Sphingomonas sinipercae]|uniref:DUF3300 domain-containing protein n=1 Tax=Sphingomonas sinipercae TaxID=2714944 RepID=A0A6G7ZK08_9SPHN|nr:hypothetical protein [Sphingomonas sinipercae]QIL01327.1 hypothetical protein G7078_00975 [Sphingomonas sinipercae]